MRPKFMEQFFKDVEDMQMDLTNIRYLLHLRLGMGTFITPLSPFKPPSCCSLGTQKITELNQKATLATSNTEEHGAWTRGDWSGMTNLRFSMR